MSAWKGYARTDTDYSAFRHVFQPVVRACVAHRIAYEKCKTPVYQSFSKSSPSSFSLSSVLASGSQSSSRANPLDDSNPGWVTASPQLSAATVSGSEVPGVEMEEDEIDDDDEMAVMMKVDQGKRASDVEEEVFPVRLLSTFIPLPSLFAAQTNIALSRYHFPVMFFRPHRSHRLGSSSSRTLLVFCDLDR